MDEQRIRELVQQFDTTSTVEIDAAWEELRELGEAVAPYLAEVYPRMRRWQGRAALLYHSTPHARTNRAVFELGLAALSDRATPVRYRACGLLAYSLNAEAIPALEQLLCRPDAKTVEDATAALDAIRHQNHHYYLDRGHTGMVRWEVGVPRDEEGMEAWLQSMYAETAEARKTREAAAAPATDQPKAGKVGRGCALLVLAAATIVCTVAVWAMAGR